MAQATLSTEGARGDAEALARDAAVNPADTHKRGVLRWGYFLLLNGIAGAIATAMFVGLLYADGIDPFLRGTYEWLLAHPGVTSMFAFSPLACSLLVGWGYSQRARKRKAAAARRAELIEKGRAKRAAKVATQDADLSRDAAPAE